MEEQRFGWETFVMSKRICVICEGQTEETFVRDTLAPLFVNSDLFIHARTILTSPGKRGGGLNYDRVKDYICKTLRGERQLFVTTMFDLYALPSNFPGFDLIKNINRLEQKLEVLTQSMHKDIVKAVKGSEARFIPYIQPYEFEALLFSDIDSWINEENHWTQAGGELKKICAAVDSPEHINNSRDTKPTIHLEKHLKNPSYSKNLHGPRAVNKIGLSRIEEKCKFFANWINCLRNLARDLE